jgi:hypothetical protein
MKFHRRRQGSFLLMISIITCSTSSSSAFHTSFLPSVNSKYSAVVLNTFTSKVQEDDESLLEDGDGRINRELAERIWNWEQSKRQLKNLPKFPYSTREALRMVSGIVHELTASKRGGGNADDLIQDGK